MDLQPRGYDKVVQLIDKGVSISNPLSLDIGDDVDVSRISGDQVILWPGCRIHGHKTVISAGCKLGAEGPVSLFDCQLGPSVELKGGYFKRSVFLEKARVGPGAQVREACLLEEDANAAHCVGLKQTILFPFVTLGSLINFCDCLMGGGTSRRDHSEVGSSYVHFNYTPDGDKTTASLFGDVPRGVMLDQPPIFLGGQGGAVGPIRLGYGTVVAAGSILLDDVLENGKLVAAVRPRSLVRDRRPRTYRNLKRVVRNNVIYLANLVALELWYREVRRPFFAKQELGDLVYAGAVEVLSLAKGERVRRLMGMAEKVPRSTLAEQEFRDRADAVCSIFESDLEVPDGGEFIDAFRPAPAGVSDYIGTVQTLAPEVRAMGTQWLGGIVDAHCAEADALLRPMDLFDRRG